jgi:hypothetical protein
VHCQRSLDFVAVFDAAVGNGYLTEIRSCGALPTSIILAFYYERVAHHSAPNPSFLVGGTRDDPELHQFLLATYRLLAAGAVSGGLRNT